MFSPRSRPVPGPVSGASPPPEPPPAVPPLSPATKRHAAADWGKICFPNWVAFPGCCAARGWCPRPGSRVAPIPGVSLAPASPIGTPPMSCSSAAALFVSFWETPPGVPPVAAATGGGEAVRPGKAASPACGCCVPTKPGWWQCIRSCAAIRPRRRCSNIAPKPPNPPTWPNCDSAPTPPMCDRALTCPRWDIAPHCPSWANCDWPRCPKGPGNPCKAFPTSPCKPGGPAKPP